ncbi:hypothetical protein CI102_15172 [Trichoderma harzianum]|nr:hypothetical protein CI102_15172 [Trichoderma harzianum]
MSNGLHGNGYRGSCTDWHGEAKERNTGYTHANLGKCTSGQFIQQDAALQRYQGASPSYILPTIAAGIQAQQTTWASNCPLPIGSQDGLLTLTWNATCRRALELLQLDAQDPGRIHALVYRNYETFLDIARARASACATEEFGKAGIASAVVATV